MSKQALGTENIKKHQFSKHFKIVKIYFLKITLFQTCYVHFLASPSLLNT